MIENMQEYVRHIRAAVSDRLDLTREVEDDEIREVISQIVAEESRQNYLSLGERQTVIETVFNSMRGLDVLQPLVDDPSITEIMINGPHHVFIEQNGRLYQKNVSFGSNDNLLNVILNIVSKVNRTVNEANPIVDARLLDGSRVNSLLAGAVAGLLIWPAIIGGVYHAAILPIVLLEMEEMGFSFLGAIDMTGLVMVSAGITLANVIMPKQKGEAAVALPGCIINICFGTFVEASYPFMFSNKIVFAGALASATVGGAIVGLFNVKGTAYVPAVLAPFMANEGKGLAFVVAMIAAMGCAFVVTMVANVVERRKNEASRV